MTAYSAYPPNERTIRHIQDRYSRADTPWFLGYSGGKDSSALLKLVFVALMHVKRRPKPVTVVYCDTGVDIPVVRQLVDRTLDRMQDEARRYDLPILVRRAAPNLEDSYFVKVIGKGYPPPTNKFRWCTDRLRINPVKRLLASMCENRSTVLLGIRRGESPERDKTISKHATAHEHLFEHADGNSIIYAPIIDYTVDQVWDTLYFNSIPESLNADALWGLYEGAGGECPIVRDPKGAPCGKGRFGCWTCTVVRKDRAVRNLIRQGYGELEPLLGFRDWLIEVRDSPAYRCRQRRNGAPGPGPFTLAARREILSRLFVAQEQSKLPLIAEEELALIQQLWDADERSVSYVE
jgi:DNA sulfur modification protein DndC